MQGDIPGMLIFKLRSRRHESHKITWNETSWTGGTADFVEEQRKELLEMRELLKLPILDGNNVLLLIQQVRVKYRSAGGEAMMITFWDCSDRNC